MTKNKKNFIFLIIPLFILVMGFALPVRAEDPEGCCEIRYGTGGGKYETLTKSKCDEYHNAKYDGERLGGTFETGKKASDDNTKCIDSEPYVYKGPSKIIPPVLSVSIPGFGKFSEVDCNEDGEQCQIPWLAEYIGAIYDYSIKIIGILAVIVIMIGGVIWLTAGSNKERFSDAMKWIKGGVTGLVIALCSYALLVILSPSLIILNPLNVTYTGKDDLEKLEELVLNGSESDYDEQPDGCPKADEIVKMEGVYCFPGRDCRARVTTVEGVKKAEAIAKQKNVNLEIHSAIRDLAGQKVLWEKYKHNTALVARPSCGAPHVRGVAIDVCLKGTESCNHMGGSNNAFYKDKDTDKLQDIMKEAGWIRYCDEWWHFQYQATPKKPCSP